MKKTNETTSAGGVASVAQPIGKMVKRKKKTEDQVDEIAPIIGAAAGAAARAGAKFIGKQFTKKAIKNKAIQGATGATMFPAKPAHAPTTKRRDGPGMNEGLADMAQRAEMDHEVQMARSDLYKIAKYAVKLHDMLKGVSEQEGIEGWKQAKITKAADYLSSVYHSLDYEMKFNEGKSPHKKGTKKYKKHMAAMHAESNDYKASLHQKLAEKAVSQSQQQAAGAALAVKRGDAPKSSLVGASKEMHDSMTKKELEDFAGTKHKGLPKKK